MIGVYVNNKSGDRYSVVGVATDCTDARDGTGVVVYCKEGVASDLFVCDAEEFEKKFTAVGVRVWADNLLS